MEVEIIKKETQLSKIVNDSGLAPSKAQVLLEKFNGYFAIAADWEAKANTITVTDASQVTEMKMAREARLFLRKKRIEVENTRKELKSDALREGQIIDSVAKILKNLIEPIEKDLESKEKFAEIQEKLRKQELDRERVAALEPYEVDTGFMDLGQMPDEVWNKYFNGVVSAHNERIEAERKAEEERIAKEKAEAEERARIKAENEKLKAEREAREKEIEEERKKARIEQEKKDKAAAKAQAEKDAKIKAEREAREKAEAELKAKQEAEAKYLEQQAAANKAARLAPDKDKLNAFAEMIDSIELPEVTNEEAQKVVSDAKLLFNKVSAFVREKANRM